MDRQFSRKDISKRLQRLASSNPGWNRKLAWMMAIGTLGIAGQLPAHATITPGTPEGAAKYYQSLPKEIGFSSTDGINKTTLNDVATYLGYSGFTGKDFQDLAPNDLMNIGVLLKSCSALPGGCSGPLQNSAAVAKALAGAPLAQNDILVTRFFAPKIMNIKEVETTRKIGWRKLIRLRAREGSAARAHHIGSGILLFNFLVNPNETGFSPANESFNTQVMLLSEISAVKKPGITGPATLYWLDYDKLSLGGLLSPVLNASFEANELSPGSSPLRPYYIPDGCVSCHGDNSRRSLVNYLDTDHWFDRLDTDFKDLKAKGTPLLADSSSNDFTSTSYKQAFDVIRKFNEEADELVRVAQPNHDEALSSAKWLELHQSNYDHFAPVDRATGTAPTWSKSSENDVKALGYLNQYCFRCHGTVKFSAFNKHAVSALNPFILRRIAADSPNGDRMPPDRELPKEIRTFLQDNLPKKAK